MKLIIVSQRVDFFADRNEYRDNIDQNMIGFLCAADYMPITISNRLIKNIAFGKVDYYYLRQFITNINPSAIVLTGGNDIGEFKDRDLTEIFMLEYARSKNIPVLGICRGMQMMGYLSGVKMHAVNGHVRSRHQLRGIINSEVNSYHNFSLNHCPKDYFITSLSEDGEIESIKHNTLTWEGWMWHPERELKFSLTDIQRIKYLFD